jgi:peroxin-12
VPRAQLGAPNDVRETLKLQDRDIWRNLAVMVGLPYLKRKLDEGYDIHAAHANVLGPGFNRDRDTLPTGASIKQRLLFYYKWFLQHIYPSVNAAYYFSLLAFNLAYLFDGSKYHSPFLWLIGTRMRRLGEADYRAIELATKPSAGSPAAGARSGEGGSIFNPRTLGRTVYPKLLSSLRIVLPASIFALKFLEWWHASDFARQLSRKAAEGIELPPPVTSGLTSTTFSKPRPSAPSDAEKAPSASTIPQNPPDCSLNPPSYSYRSSSAQFLSLPHLHFPYYHAYRSAHRVRVLLHVHTPLGRGSARAPNSVHGRFRNR